MRIHKNTKRPTMSLTCTSCDKTYRDRTGLYYHLNTHHRPPKIPKRFTCKICHMTFTRRYSLSRHTKNHKRQNKEKLAADMERTESLESSGTSTTNTNVAAGCSSRSEIFENSSPNKNGTKTPSHSVVFACLPALQVDLEPLPAGLNIDASHIGADDVEDQSESIHVSRQIDEVHKSMPMVLLTDILNHWKSKPAWNVGKIPNLHSCLLPFEINIKVEDDL